MLSHCISGPESRFTEFPRNQDSLWVIDLYMSFDVLYITFLSTNLTNIAFDIFTSLLNRMFTLNHESYRPNRSSLPRILVSGGQLSCQN